MLKRRCPFVGLCGDPDTVVAFASLRNCCNRVEDPSPIRLSYQHSHCFTFNHRQCEVLLEEQPPSVLPSAIAENPTRKRAAIIVGSVASLFVVAMFVVFLFSGWQSAEAVDKNSGNRQKTAEATMNLGVSGGLPGDLTSTPKSKTPSDILLPIVGAAATQTFLPSLNITEIPVEDVQSPTATKTPTAISTSCGAPDGWVIYIVKVGDTLTSIAEDQGVSITELQNANCLTAAAVYVGQRLYVPHNYVSTPVPTWTATKIPPATAAFTNTPFPTKTQEPTEAPTQEPTLQPTLEPTATEIPPLPTETSPPIPSETPIPPPTDPPGPTATPTPISLPITPTP